MTLDATVSFLTETHPWLVWVLLFGSALLEYVFPPFPGDTVTLAGAVLVTAYGVPAPAVLFSVLAGSLVGSAADYGLGVLAARGTWPGAERFFVVRRAREGAEALARAFARHGEALIMVNRFLPGVRAFLFVAAGMAGMRFWLVMLYAAISALAWNLLLLAAGMAVGSRIEDLQALFRSYQGAVWGVLALAVAILAGRWWWRRRRTRPESPQGLDNGQDHPAE